MKYVALLVTVLVFATLFEYGKAAPAKWQEDVKDFFDDVGEKVKHKAHKVSHFFQGIGPWFKRLGAHLKEFKEKEKALKEQYHRSYHKSADDNNNENEINKVDIAKDLGMIDTDNAVDMGAINDNADGIVMVNIDNGMGSINDNADGQGLTNDNGMGSINDNADGQGMTNDNGMDRVNEMEMGNINDMGNEVAVVIPVDLGNIDDIATGMVMENNSEKDNVNINDMATALEVMDAVIKEESDHIAKEIEKSHIDETVKEMGHYGHSGYHGHNGMDIDHINELTQILGVNKNPAPIDMGSLVKDEIDRIDQEMERSTIDEITKELGMNTNDVNDFDRRILGLQ